MHTPYLLLGLLSTAQQTSSPGSDKTSLLTLSGVSRDGGGLADMLMVTLRGRVSLPDVIPVGGALLTPP